MEDTGGKLQLSAFFELAYQAATHEPCQRLDEKILREVSVLFRGPRQHRLVPCHGWQLLLVKDKPWRAMRQPANVFEGFANQAARLPHKPSVQRASHGGDPRKDEAFRRFGREKQKTIAAGKVADEESGRSSADRRLSCRQASLSKSHFGRGEKPVTSQAPATRRHGFVALQIRRGQCANPRDGITGRFSRPPIGADRLTPLSRNSARAFPRGRFFQRPSNG
jgi:hypothetical protein